MPNLNSIVLMSDADNFSNEAPINPYYRDEYINMDIAKQEHDNIQTCLIKAGIKVVSVPSPAGCQDGVYTANWALVRGNKAVIASLPNARKKEEEYAEKVLKNIGKEIYRLPDNLKFSGQGDSLPCGDLLFCGSNYRSDAEAQKIASEILGYKRIQLQTIPMVVNKKPVINKSSGWLDSYFYDIDLALAIIKSPTPTQKGIIAYCPEAFTEESRQTLESLNMVDKIIVSLKEAQESFATNLVSTGETVVMSANAPEFTQKLINIGLKVINPEIKELAKGGGYIRCVTLTID